MGDIVAGILYGTRLKVERVLRERKAFDKNTAVDPEEAGINYKHVLGLMEKGGLIEKTHDGKVYLTGKGSKSR